MVSKNPYTRLKDETDAKIASLTEQNAAFRKENKALEESWNKVLADLSTARSRVLAVEHTLTYGILLSTAAREASTYLARSWTTGPKGRKMEVDLWDAADLYHNAYQAILPTSNGLGSMFSQYKKKD